MRNIIDLKDHPGMVSGRGGLRGALSQRELNQELATLGLDLNLLISLPAAAFEHYVMMLLAEQGISARQLKVLLRVQILSMAMRSRTDRQTAMATSQGENHPLLPSNERRLFQLQLLARQQQAQHIQLPHGQVVIHLATPAKN